MSARPIPHPAQGADGRGLDGLMPVLGELDGLGKKPRTWARSMVGAAAFALGPAEHLPAVIGGTMGDALGHVFREPGVFSEVTDGTVYYVTDAYLVHVTKSKESRLVRWALLSPDRVTYCPVAVEMKDDWSAFAPREWSLGGAFESRDRAEILGDMALTVSLYIRCLMTRRRLIDQGAGFNAFSGVIEPPTRTRRRGRR